MTGLEMVLEYLPTTIRNKIEEVLNVRTECSVEEIRLRSNNPLILKT